MTFKSKRRGILLTILLVVLLWAPQLCEPVFRATDAIPNQSCSPHQQV